MLLAQAKELTEVSQRAMQSAETYGLIGYLLVGVLLVIVAAIAAAAKFMAPLLTRLTISTVELHTSVKETNLRLAMTLDKVTDDHGDKLSDIREIVDKIQNCPYAPTLPSQSMPPNLTPLPHGV